MIINFFFGENNQLDNLTLKAGIKTLIFMEGKKNMYNRKGSGGWWWWGLI